MAQQQPQDALDRVQLEINRLFELTGRALGATKTANHSTALATASKLKQILPPSFSNYHAALDELEERLHYAKLVMRRDLAVLREKARAEAEAQRILASTAETEIGDSKAAAAEAQASQADPVSTHVPAHEQAHTTTEPAEDTDDVMIVEQNDMNDLALKTDDDYNVGNEAAPDTAFSTNADMDSLFNDTTSQDELKGQSTMDHDATTTHANANTSGEFDFANFNANLPADTQSQDDLSTLLPGLPPFAGEGEDKDDPDFSDLFGPQSNTEGPTKLQSAGGTGQDDFNFDDMMDFGIDTENNDTASGDATQLNFELDLS